MEEETTSTAPAENQETESQTNEPTPNTNEEQVQDIDKLIQAKAEKLNSESRKKIGALENELAKLRKEKLTADELKKIEIEEKEIAIAERERALADKENRLAAVKTLKEVGLDDGTPESDELLDFIMADNEDTIRIRAKSLKSAIDKRVEAEVNRIFKAGGRTPGRSNTQSQGDTETGLAETIGKKRAESLKRSREILDSYKRR